LLDLGKPNPRYERVAQLGLPFRGVPRLQCRRREVKLWEPQSNVFCTHPLQNYHTFQWVVRNLSRT
jgi:hypothetical protein